MFIMATPRRLTTPRRLFPMTTTKYHATGSALQKRRRVTRYTPRSTTRRRKTVKEIVQDLSQEKKVHTYTEGFTNKHRLDARLVGQTILPGSAKWARIGNQITLTGISIKGEFTNASNPTTAFGGNTCGAIKLKIWIVQTKRNEDPTAFWFQDPNSNLLRNYNTGFTNDPTGDTNRSRARMNLLDIKVLARKSWITYPPRDIQQTFESTKSVNMFLKLKKPVVITYNSDNAVGPSYAASEVTPNIWICVTHFQPHTGVTNAQTLAQTNLSFTYYYRE